jgi:predicted nucleic acid-binding protein
MSILIDTNVLLDVMLCRNVFYPDSRAVFEIVETNVINAFVSAVSMTNIFYIFSASLNRTLTMCTPLWTIYPHCSP